MRANLLILLLLFGSTNLFSQETYQRNSNQKEVSNQTLLRERIDVQTQKIEALQALIDDNAKELTLNAEELSSLKNENKQIKNLGNRLNIYITATFIAIVVLLFFNLILYAKLKKVIRINKQDLNEKIRKATDILRIDLSNHINKTTDEIRESQLKSDDELIKLFKMQMTLMIDEKEVDKRLVAKVSEDIKRIRKNLNQSNPESKAINQLHEDLKQVQEDIKKWL